MYVKHLQRFARLNKGVSRDTRLLWKEKAGISTPMRMLAVLPVERLKNSKGEYFEMKKESKYFEEFYRSQKICTEEEFPDFIAACREGLPSVFRVVLCRPEANLIMQKLRKGFFSDAGLSFVSWYPDKNTWKFDKTRWDLVENPNLKKYHRILDNWRNTGNIYRQEQVSMVPVACLDIKPHHKVLDMCAAPGSKTGQVLEAMHTLVEAGTVPSGVLVANEPDPGRCKILAGNMKLFSSPCILVTSYRGESFPDILDSDGQPILYDRIVCDVPCSGDGTIRKNPNVWMGWHPGRGNMRFHLQLNIARRGVHLLQEGGLMAYSSCSMNQIENECVVAQLIEESNGGLELVDMKDSLPGLKYEPGLDEWCVFDTNMTQYKDFDSVPTNLRSQICREMFPTENRKYLNLHRSMRFLPHQNDDGGFFVAILRKIKHFQSKKMNQKTNKGPVVKGVPILHKLCEKREMNVDEFERFKDLFGVHLNRTNIFSRAEKGKDGTSFFYMNDALKSILDRNPSLDAALVGMRILRREARNSAQSKFSFVSENLHMVKSYVTKRNVTVPRGDFLQLVNGDQVKLAELTEETRRNIANFGHGQLLISFADFDTLFPAFSGKDSITLELTKLAMENYRTLLGVD